MQISCGVKEPHSFQPDREGHKINVMWRISNSIWNLEWNLYILHILINKALCAQSYCSHHLIKFKSTPKFQRLFFSGEEACKKSEEEKQKDSCQTNQQPHFLEIYEIRMWIFFSSWLARHYASLAP